MARSDLQLHDGPVTQSGESPISKAGWSVITGVITSLLLVILTPFVAGQVAARLQEPSCSNPRGLSPIVPSAAQGDFLSNRTGSYPPANLIDGNTSTVWSEGKDGAGLGSSISFAFKGTPDLRLLCIVNGHGKSWDLYQRNSRVRLASISDSSRSSIDVMLADAGTPDRPAIFQGVSPPFGETSAITVTIKSAYAAQVSGNRPSYADTCLSEIEFWAEP